MEKKNRNIVLKFLSRIHANAALSLLFYTLYYLIVYYFIINNLEWTWRYAAAVLSLGVFSGLFFRFVIYGEGYDRKKRIRILIWIIAGAVIIGAAVEVIIKRIT